MNKDYEQKMKHLKLQQQTQAEQLAMQQDMRYRDDPSEDRWLNEASIESPREDDTYGIHPQKKPSFIKRFLSGFGSRISKPRDASNKRHFELHRENARSMLNYENKFNRPFGPRGNDKLSLMGSEQKSRIAPLRFTTAPKIGSLKKFTNNLSMWRV